MAVTVSRTTRASHRAVHLYQNVRTSGLSSVNRIGVIAYTSSPRADYGNLGSLVADLRPEAVGDRVQAYVSAPNPSGVWTSTRWVLPEAMAFSSALPSSFTVLTLVPSKP